MKKVFEKKQKEKKEKKTGLLINWIGNCHNILMILNFRKMHDGSISSMLCNDFNFNVKDVLFEIYF